MDGSHGDGGSTAPPPFLTKTYEMVDDPLTNSIVSWSHSGHSFVVWNPMEFARDLLPKFFKHNNFSSFVRQLNTYGFRKIDPDQWEFANEDFIRGFTHLLKNIHRRKPIHSHSAQGSSSVSFADSERREFEEKIKKLKSDNNLLQLELQKHELQNQGFEPQMQSLRESLLNIVNRQRHLMLFLAQLLQKPGISSTFLQHSETHNKKRRLLVSNYLRDESNLGENHIVSLQKDNPDAKSVPVVKMELIEKLESSLDFWENFLHGFRETPCQQMHDSAVLLELSPALVAEMGSSSVDSDLNVQPCSPSSSSHSKDISLSPELTGSLNHVNGPFIPTVDHIQNAGPRFLGIDVNTEPVHIPEVDVPKDHVAGTVAPTVPTGYNDVFWEQFLTETPGSSDALEIHSESRDIDQKKGYTKPVGEKMFCWNMNNVDNLTEQMGHFTPAEMI